MTEVFISYAHEDEVVARSLAGVFEAEGLAVWWDRGSIEAGDDYEDEIETALDSAGSAIVLWSTKSTGSEWVKIEVRRADKRTILIPVVIDERIVSGETSLPLRFEGRLYVDLSRWDGRTECPELEDLVTRVKKVLRRSETVGRQTTPVIHTSWKLPLTSIGSRGTHARALQELLALVGFSLDVDGIVGRGSRTAVRRFQSSKGLDADGIVGPDTWVSLIQDVWYRVAAKPLLSLGSKGDHVRRVQEQLVGRGHGIEIDATFGSATLAAVKQLQREVALNADGVVGPDTQIALIIANPRET